MNNAPFGTLASLYHRPRQPMQQPMQGGQPMQGRPQGFPQVALGQLMGQMLGIPQQRRPRQAGAIGGSPMDAIVAQLMQRGR